MVAYIYIYFIPMQNQKKYVQNKNRFGTKMWTRGVIFSIFSNYLFNKTTTKKWHQIESQFLIFSVTATMMSTSSAHMLVSKYQFTLKGPGFLENMTDTELRQGCPR